ncbi:MAG: glycosyltransferase family 9 protein [Candidatus Omnitrophota bacterium]|jgi:lipopolysaccharide heptosyltransferase II
MKKILIINPFGIGDVIFSTPLIEALKKNFPDSFIGYICNKRVYDVIRSNPNLNKIYVYEKDDYRAVWQSSKLECVKRILSFLKSVKKEKFDLVIDLSLGYQFGLFLKVVGIRNRLGFNYRNRGKFLTRKIDIDGFNDKHVIEYYLDMLTLLDIDPGKYRTYPKIYLAERDSVWADDFLRSNGITEKDIVVGVIPGCGASWGQDAKYRRWDKAGFAIVADNAIERYGAKVLLFGSAKEVGICEDVLKLMKHEAIIACGKTSLRDFLGLLRRCKVVITNDGGPLHMAVAIGVNTVSIFGPVDEKIYGPYPVGPGHIVISKRALPCRPCYKKFKHNICDNRLCLKGIAPSEVIEAVDALMVRAGK